MDIFKTIRIGFASALIMSLAVMTSCSTNDPIDQIPEDVDFAATINLQKVADELGVVITGTDVKLPEDFEAFDNNIPEEVNDIIVASHQAIDLSQIAVFGYIKTNDNPDVYLVAKVIDEKSLDAILTDELDFDYDSDDGFKVYTLESKSPKASILVKDGLAWILADKKVSAAVKSVNKMMRKSAEEKLTESRGLSNALTADNVCNAVLNTTPFIKLFDRFGRYEFGTEAAVAISSALSQTKGYWFAYTADMNKTGFEMTARFVNPEGKVLELPYAQDIDTDFLTFVPDYYQGSYSVGINGDAIKEMIDNLETLAEKNTRGAEKELCMAMLNHMRNIDGTISINLGTTDIQKLIFGEDAKALDFIATIEMKSGKASSAIDGIYSLLKQHDPNGEIIKSTGIGKMNIFIRNYGTIAIEAIDDHVVISNKEITKGNSNSNLKSAVIGNQVTMYIGVPSFADLTNDTCKFGANAEVSYKDGVCKATLDFTNLESSMVSSMVELVLCVDQTYQSYRNTYWKSLYGY